MGTKYICDICEKEYTKKGTNTFWSSVAADSPPGRWGIIACVAPKTKQDPPDQTVIALTGEPKAFLVCSQVCAEKALVIAKEHLQKAFAELS